MMSIIQLLPDRMAAEAEEQLRLEGYLGYSRRRNQSHRSEKIVLITASSLGQLQSFTRTHCL